MKKSTPLKNKFFRLIILLGIAYSPAIWAGDGTIPLKITGGLATGSSEETPVKNGNAVIKNLVRMNSNSFSCLKGSGNNGIKKYRAQGSIKFGNKKLSILAFCYKPKSNLIQIISVDRNSLSGLIRFTGSAKRK
jgi:hypothetical protein